MRSLSHALLMILLLLALPAAAQTNPRDYAITNVNFLFSPDRAQFTLSIDIQNRGGEGTPETPLRVDPLRDSRVIAVAIGPPLARGASDNYTFTFNTVDFADASILLVQVEVGLDAFELPRSPIAENNVRQISVPIPTDIPTPQPGVAPTSAPIVDVEDVGEAPAAEAPFVVFAQNEDGTYTILNTVVTSEQALVGAGTLLALLLLLWLITVILRLIFQRPATLSTWQPPYASGPYYDPNSLQARRFGWQMHAQNSLLLAPPIEGNLYAIKRLQGLDGAPFANWKLKGARLSQYDSYGRVARSQTLIDGRTLKRLQNVLRQRKPLDDAALQKRLRPVARQMVQRLRKNIHQKNAFLPVALDLRLEGKHGDIRIFFELYQCRAGAWYRIDQWEPELLLLGRSIEENFTYTLNGMGSGETYKAFLERLQQDLIWLLTETARHPLPPQPTETGSHARAPEMNIPDSLSGTQPIGQPDTRTPSSSPPAPPF